MYFTVSASCLNYALYKPGQKSDQILICGYKKKGEKGQSYPPADKAKLCPKKILLKLRCSPADYVILHGGFAKANRTVKLLLDHPVCCCTIPKTLVWAKTIPPVQSSGVCF